MEKLRQNSGLTGWLLISPMALVLLVFLIVPALMITVVNLWNATEFSIVPAFQFDNCTFLFGPEVTNRVFLNAFKFALLTWICTFAIGFTVAYYPPFHIRAQSRRIALFLLCTIPF